MIHHHTQELLHQVSVEMLLFISLDWLSIWVICAFVCLYWEQMWCVVNSPTFLVFGELFCFVSAGKQ